MCMKERERKTFRCWERECQSRFVCVCVCVCVCMLECVCVYAWVCVKEREIVCLYILESVLVSEWRRPPVENLFLISRFYFLLQTKHFLIFQNKFTRGFIDPVCVLKSFSNETIPNDPFFTSCNKLINNLCFLNTKEWNIIFLMSIRNTLLSCLACF